MKNATKRTLRMLVALGSAVGCAGGGDSVASVKVVAIEISPPNGVVVVGKTLQLTATARNGQGTAVTSAGAGWRSSNGEVASVSQTGVVTGVSAGGPVTITATAEGKAANAILTVTVGRLAIEA